MNSLLELRTQRAIKTWWVYYTEHADGICQRRRALVVWSLGSFEPRTSIFSLHTVLEVLIS